MRIVFSLALALAAASPVAQAQELRGSVRGTVYDSSGGTVAGAKLTLRNINTNVAVERDSSSTGAYVFDFVSPGTYSLVVGMQGFRGFQQDNILVQTRSDITVDAKLEVGAVNETVRVEAAPITVQFNKTTMETTLDTKMSNSLPIIHRNPFLLLQLDPQVTFTSTSQEQSPFHHWAGSRLDVGGGTQLKNDILVDGSPNTWGPKTNYVPPMDAVSELNVQQNATDAEYGHSAGGIVSLQMKSGSNDWHGTVYYFGRNPKLNARPDSTTPTPSLIRHNVWGVTAGNPIIKNKLFNYIAYEGQNLREPINLIKTLPTARERTGDFSQTMFLDGGRTGMKPIFDPWTTQTEGSNVTRMPFPGNIIPRSQMDPVALRFLNDIWAPNGPGDDVTQVNNYRLTFARVYDYYNWSNRTDWNVNDKWKIFGRFSRYHTNVASPNPAGTPAGSTGGSERNSMTAVGDAVWTVNANTVVSFRGSYGKPVDRFIDPIAEIKSFGEFFPQNPTFFDSYAKSLPVTYYPGLNLGGTFGRGSYWYSAPDFWNGQGKISKNVGRHYLKIGGEFRRYRGNSSLPQPLQFTFPAANTANTYINTNTRLSGSEWATFLIGAIGDNSRARNTPMLLARNYFFGGYIQDDFKLSQNITLNLGLRWEYDTPIVDRDGRLSRTLDLTNPIPDFQGANAPNLGAATMAIRRNLPQYNGAWIHTSDAGDGAYSNSKLGFQPRFGLAWRLSDRMSFRAGYSRYAIMPSVDIEGGINLNDVVPYPGYQQDSFPLPTVAGVPAARFSNPWPANNPLTPPVERRLGRYTELGSTAQSIIWNQNLGTAYNDRFSFSLQRQLPSQIVVDATYFMSFGFNQRYQQQLNNIDPRFGFQFQNAVNAQVPNPFFNVLPFDKFPGGLRNVRNVAVGDLLRPYPHYGPITMWNAEGVYRSYRSIQFKAQRPFVNGFNFLIGYNYNNARSDEFYPDGVQVFLNNLSLQDSSNARHKFNIGGIYELPFGKGRKYGSSMNKGLNLLLGGWALSGIYQQVSGEYLRLPGALVSANPAISNPTRDRWFDTTKVTRLPAFTQRTNPLQFPGFTGPGVISLDLTLGKEFQIKEKYTFELKMESYNLPNYFNGANPQLNPDSSLFGRVTGQRNTYFGRQFQYTSRIRW